MLTLVSSSHTAIDIIDTYSRLGLVTARCSVGWRQDLRSRCTMSSDWWTTRISGASRVQWLKGEKAVSGMSSNPDYFHLKTRPTSSSSLLNLFESSSGRYTLKIGISTRFLALGDANYELWRSSVIDITCYSLGAEDPPTGLNSCRSCTKSGDPSFNHQCEEIYDGGT